MCRWFFQQPTMQCITALKSYLRNIWDCVKMSESVLISCSWRERDFMKATATTLETLITHGWRLLHAITVTTTMHSQMPLNRYYCTAFSFSYFVIFNKSVIYTVSQKSTPLRLLHIFLLVAILCRWKFTQLLPFISSPICQFGPLISIFVRTATLFVTLTPEFEQFISVYCNIHKLLSEINSLHYIKSYSKLLTSNCYVSDQILFLKCPALADTHFQDIIEYFLKFKEVMWLWPRPLDGFFFSLKAYTSHGQPVYEMWSL